MLLIYYDIREFAYKLLYNKVNELPVQVSPGYASEQYPANPGHVTN